MEIKFNVEKEDRKALVRAVADITGCDSVYKGAPGFAFVVGDYTIDRYGTLSFHEGVWLEAQPLLAELVSRGYVCEGIIEPVIPSEPAPVEVAVANKDAVCGDTEASPGGELTEAIADDAPETKSEVGDDASASADDESAGSEPTPSTAASELDSLRSVVDEDGLALTIEVPLAGFTSVALDNLHRLISGKAGLIAKALGTDALPIERTADTLRFSWFPVVSSHLEVDAYTRFVHALCELAKKQKRVTLTEKPIDPNASEKFAFRCFLLRLGFIGKDTNIASARKILLSKLSGNGSFKSGDHNNRKSAADTKAADDGERSSAETTVNEEVVFAPDTEVSTEIPKPLRCQECHHHCYCTDGVLRTSTGDLVNTSKRTPDNYTHYCLGVPSGYRKLKHAVDWTSSETPPKWCPLADGEVAE